MKCQEVSRYFSIKRPIGVHFQLGNYFKIPPNLMCPSTCRSAKQTLAKSKDCKKNPTGNKIELLVIDKRIL